MVPRDAPVKLGYGSLGHQPKPDLQCQHTRLTIPNATPIFILDVRGKPRGELGWIKGQHTRSVGYCTWLNDVPIRSLKTRRQRRQQKAR